MMIDFDLVQCISDHEGFEHVCVLNMWVLQATYFSICGFYKLLTFLTDMQRYGTGDVWKESQGI